LPITESWIFWQRKEALQWAQKTSYPVVFKLRGGAGSHNVILVKSIGEAVRLINRMFGRGVKSGSVPSANNVRIRDFNIYKISRRLAGNILRRYRHEDTSTLWAKHKNYILFQKFLPKNEYDTRVTVIGNRAFAFRRINRKNDFRSSGSGVIDYDKKYINEIFLKTAFEISKKMQFQSMAYDFLYNEDGGPECCEISYTYQAKAIYNCEGYWDDQLNWHEGHFWPQYLNLKDMLKLPELKQPEIKL